MQVAHWYGLAVLAMLGLAWGSRDHVAQKLGLCLLASWSATQIAEAWLGLPGVPLLMPSVQVALAIVVAGVGYFNKSRLAAIVFGLYGLLIGIHLLAWVTQSIGAYGYFLAANVVFLSQVLIVGGAGGAGMVRHWLLRGSQRGSPVRARGDRMAPPTR